MQNDKGKMRVLILIILLLVVMVIVCLTRGLKSSNKPYLFEEEIAQQEKSVSESTIEKVLFEKVPELYAYKDYIQEKSECQAELCIQIYETVDITDDSMLKEGKYYPIYVGESWETHNVNWDWFYISQDLEMIYWNDIVEGVYYSLDEWRLSDKYRILKEDELRQDSENNLIEALDIAQDERIQELATILSECIGEWSVQELILPMAIGQDSTRGQLGMELSLVDIEIFNNYSVKLEEEIYTVHDISIKDYEWYLDRFRQGPHFAEGLIVELEYVNIEEDKRFSICIAENEMYLLSYAYGFYTVVRQDEKTSVSIGEIEKSILDKLSNAYIKRYGDTECYLKNICGVWEGKKYSFADEWVKVEDDYELELQYKNEMQLLIVFEEKEIEAELQKVYSTGSYTEERYFELLDIPQEIRPYLRLYSEEYFIHLKQNEEDIYIVLSKGDSQQRDYEKKMEIYIEGELYSFQ